MEGKAILHMAGHSHGMEEFQPRNGVTTIVQGAGGRALYTFDPRLDSVWFDNSHFGLCRLELDDDGPLTYRLARSAWDAAAHDQTCR
jgi:hypothetical protein